MFHSECTCRRPARKTNETTQIMKPFSPNFHSAVFLAISLSITATPLRAKDWPQWRGPNRNGVSLETGLLKEWPKDGPKLI